MLTATAPSPLPGIDTGELVAAYAKARASLVAFRHILLENDQSKERAPAAFHFQWSDDLLHGTRHIALEAFRESAKTQYVMRAFPLYCLTFPFAAADYVVIIKNNATLARNKLHEIEREFVENPALCARLIRVIEQSAEAFEVLVTDDDGKEHSVRIEAYGKGASIRGLSTRDRRPKVLLIDDPQDKEDAQSETVQEQDWEWFLSDVMFLSKACRIFLIGNNLGEKCIIERAIVAAEELGFVSRRVPTLIEGQSAWPAMHSLEEIQTQREAYERMGQIDIWLREKMCTAVSVETQIFSADDYRAFSPSQAKSLMRDALLFCTMDPGWSQKASSCFRAICVNAVTQEGYWFLLEIRYGRWPTSMHMDIIFETVTRWQLRSFGIEKGEYQEVIEPILYEEMARRKVFFDVVPLEHAKQGSKLERIKMLSPRFKAHTIWLPSAPVYQDANPKHGEGNWITELKAELAGVTREEIKSLFIDLADALAMQEQVAQAPYRPRAMGDLPRRALTNARLLS